jgi:hypothetical protein
LGAQSSGIVNDHTVKGKCRHAVLGSSIKVIVSKASQALISLTGKRGAVEFCVGMAKVVFFVELFIARLAGVSIFSEFLAALDRIRLANIVPIHKMGTVARKTFVFSLFVFFAVVNRVLATLITNFEVSISTNITC